MSEPADRAEILRAIARIPLLSSSTARLLRLTADPEHDLKAVAGIVKYDSALTARVLRVVNSAAYGLVQPVHTIERAIAYLGERLIVSLALGDSAAQLFEKNLDGYGGERGDLWRHDLRCAIASREVARLALDELSPDLAFTAGLLHDVGKAVISDFLAGRTDGLLEAIDRRQVSDYLAGEQETLGIDHSQAGQELAQAWGLPEPLQMAIGHHHRPALAPTEHRSLAYAVHLGDIIAMMGGCGTGADSLRYPLDNGYQQFYRLSPDDLARIMLLTEEEFRQIESSLHHSREKET